MRRRKTRRRSDAKLTRRQILAAHKLYKTGLTAGQVAQLIWQRWGYKSAEVAERSLLRAFRLDGLEVRPPGIPVALASRPCTGCGCVRTERTPGCLPCVQRHSKWKLAGLPSKPGRTACAGCGGSLDLRTVGCATCASRLDQRRRYVKRGSARPPEETGADTSERLQEAA